MIGLRLAFFIGVLIAILTGCTVCRHTAITDAETYACRGYKTRVATYYLAGSSHDSHAQAQVLDKDGQWKWVGMLGGIIDAPDYYMRQEGKGIDYYYWSVPEYRKLLEDNGKSTPRIVICK